MSGLETGAIDIWKSSKGGKPPKRGLRDMGIRTSNPGDPGDGGDGGVVRPESFSSHLFPSFPIWDAVDRERIGCNGTGPG